MPVVSYSPRGAGSRQSKRRIIALFRWIVEMLGAKGLLDGLTVAIDGTALEANAAMRSIQRRDGGRNYDEDLKDLAQAEGI